MRPRSLARRRLTCWRNLALIVLLIGSGRRSCQGLVVVSPLWRPTATTFRRLAYVSPESGNSNNNNSLSSASTSAPLPAKPKPYLFPQVGDIVRYYDLDGGRADGQVLVGKITFIQKQLLSDNSKQTDKRSSSSSGWLVELSELEDTGDGYYAEYPRRRSKQGLRDLATVSPIAASWVRNENAFKVPRTRDGVPVVRAEQYDIASYTGPLYQIDESVVQADNEVYQALKGRLLRLAAIVGFGGTVIADLVKGPEDAAIYGAGVLASVVYLFFLSLKTDTIASSGAKYGSNVSNLRFVMPVLLLIGVAVYNQSRGNDNPVLGKGTFDYVTTEQFAAAIIGFLTYRIPLFAIQIQDSMKDATGDVVLPGSAGVAMQLAQQQNKSSEVSKDALSSSPLTTILLVSGPQATGRSELVKKLINEGEDRFVEPDRVDRVKDPANFERIEQRGEFLSVDRSERYGYSKRDILSSAKKAQENNAVVVVDADVDLARKLTKIGGLRIVGVWVGLNGVAEFEQRLGEQIDSGEIPLPEGETKDSVVRARIKEIVQEIEFGLSSGVFEFTILNKNEEDSVKQLKEAASYCF